MENKHFDGIVDSLMEGMQQMLSAKTVVGEPTKIGDTIIIPLVDVSMGVGAGSKDEEKKKRGAGGFGAKMSPTAVLVIRNGQTKLVNIKNQDAVTKILDLVPDVINKFQGSSKNDMPSDEDVVDAAFGDDEK
jgi:uncharacterized spore protein YtfJ